MNTWPARLQWMFLALLIALSAAVAALWILSICRPDAWTFSGDHYVWNFNNQSGRLTVAVFSLIPEDEAYYELALPYWLAEAIALPAALLVAWRMIKTRRELRARGFPL